MTQGKQVLERVVLVDDEPDIQEVARLALETVGGLEVTIFPSGQALLERTDELDDQLLLLDVMMPGMDGPTTLGALRERIRRVPPVIFMTAKVQPQEVRELKALGAHGVIAKPFDPMTLADEVKRIWAGRGDDG